MEFLRTPGQPKTTQRGRGLIWLCFSHQNHNHHFVRRILSRIEKVDWTTSFRQLLRNGEVPENFTGCLTHVLYNTDGNIWWPLAWHDTADILSGLPVYSSFGFNQSYLFVGYVAESVPCLY